MKEKRSEISTHFSIALLLFVLFGLPAQGFCMNLNRLPCSEDSLRRSDSLAFNVLENKTAEVLLSTQRTAESGVKASDFDQIHTMRGESIVVKVTGTNVFEVLYTWPLNTIEQKMPREEVSEIVYADGHREAFRLKPSESKQESKSWAVEVSEKDWERVSTLDTSANAEGLVELGRVTARFEAAKINASNEYLEKNALIILKKKAVLLGSNVLLVADRKEYRPYGELPSMELSGIAYLKQ